MAEPTIAAGFAKALMDLAISKGAEKTALIDQSGIAPGDLADQDNRIPLAKYLALLDTGAQLCRDPALALHFGEAYSMPDLSIVGLICQAAKTPMEAFEQMNRFSRLVVDADDGKTDDWFELIEDEKGTWFTLSNDIYINHPALVESAFARGMSAKARADVESFRIKEIHFAHDAPDYRTEYDRVFAAPLVFGSDKNGALIDNSWTFDGPLDLANGYVFGVLSERAEALLKSLENAKTARGQVESLLIPRLHTGDINMDEVAKKMGLSRTTLYRKLKAEGVSFEKLLDDLRYQMALNYLNGEKTSVNEVAYLVGFSEPSAFSRAFKRWTGRSPSAGQ